jgi:hypothetical protein
MAAHAHHRRLAQEALEHRKNLTEKYCPGCDETKPVGDFHWRNKAEYRRAKHCKLCVSAYMKKRNADPIQREKNLTYIRNYVKLHPEKSWDGWYRLKYIEWCEATQQENTDL